MNREQLDQLIPQAKEAVKLAKASGDEMAVTLAERTLTWFEQRREELDAREARRKADDAWAELASPRELAARVGS